MIRIFLSHSSKDKENAGKLKRELHYFRIDVFVAHDDIEGGEEWMNSLLEELCRCDGFILLLSKNYHIANYTDHETGIALGLGKPIIPISMDDTEPYGFISKYQAINGKKGIGSSLCHQIAERIYKKVSAKGKYIDLLINALAESQSYDQANSISRLLFNGEDFSNTQVNRIVSTYLDNYEVRGGFTSSREIKRLIQKRKDDLNAEVRKHLEEI